jgi:hypothetical protein
VVSACPRDIRDATTDDNTAAAVIVTGHASQLLPQVAHAVAMQYATPHRTNVHPHFVVDRRPSLIMLSINFSRSVNSRLFVSPLTEFLPHLLCSAVRGLQPVP